MNFELKGCVFTCNCAYSLSHLFTFLKMDRNRVSLTSFAVAMSPLPWQPLLIPKLSEFTSFLVMFKMCPWSKFFPYQFRCK